MRSYQRLAGPVLAALVLLPACRGENRPNVDVIGGSGNVSVSASSIGPGETGGPSGAGGTSGRAGTYTPKTNVDAFYAIGADLSQKREYEQLLARTLQELDAGRVDEAWALIAGPLQSTGRTASLLGIAAERERDFALEGKLSVPLEATLAVAAAQKNDRPTFERAVTEVRGYLNGIFYLSVLRVAKQLESENTAVGRAARTTEGLAYWKAIRAAVAGGSANAATTLNAAFGPGAPNPWTAADTARIYAALNDAAVLRALGVPTALQITTPR